MKSLEKYIHESQIVDEGVITSAIGISVFMVWLFADILVPNLFIGSNIDSDYWKGRIAINGVIVSFFRWIYDKVQLKKSNDEFKFFQELEEKLNKDPEFVAWKSQSVSKRRKTDLVPIIQRVLGEEEKRKLTRYTDELFREYKNTANNY